ncbi:MAG: hypothetical protein P4M04_01140 [Acidobacteriota bacterium]|nr:hypothetical protein [Acidobacteriota bacterium]
MRKLAPVEEARTIMTEGMEWGVWKWLLEKKRVREIADRARAALDQQEMKVKESWSDDLKIVYNQLVAENGDARRGRKGSKPGTKAGTPKIDPALMTAAKRVKEADDIAYDAHETAEDVFAEAEKRMSTAGAREGARMALEAYDRHEEAIRKAEALAPKK